MIVMKFGGTSVQTADSMNRVFDIVRKRAVRRPLVVLSACGGFTNKLLALAARAANREDFNAEFRHIHEHHTELVKTLVPDENALTHALHRVESLLSDLKNFCEGISLLGECTARSLDMAASFGERLSTEIFYHCCRSRGLDAELIDARTVMRTNSDFTSAEFDMKVTRELSREKILPLVEAGRICITQGFIGSNSKGITTTLGRGGSDLSGAIYGAALDAESIEIWTDVSGVFSADPRKVKKAHVIPQMSYMEARDLSFYGAKVLHPDTVKPAIDRGIPVVVLNTFEAEHPGTTIVREPTKEDYGIRAVTLKENCLLYSCQMLTAVESIPQDGREKILAQVCSEGGGVLIVDSSLEKYFPENGKKISLLCATGPNIFSLQKNSSVIAEVANILAPFHPKAFLFGSSPVSVLAAIEPERAQEAMIAVHGLTEMQVPA